MKKIISLAGLVFLLALAACGKKEGDGIPEPSAKESKNVGIFNKFIGEDPKDDENVKSESIERDVESLVDEIYHVNKNDRSEYGYMIPYRYSVPKLNIDTDAAREINKDIEENVLKEAKRLETEDSYETALMQNIEYFTYIRNNILSLVIRMEDEMCQREYFVYNYDLETDKRLEDKELLLREGKTYEELTEDLSRYMVRDFDLSMRGIPGDPYYLDFYYTTNMELRQRSALIKKDELKLFEGNDSLMAIVTQFTPAGAGIYSIEAPVCFDTDKNDVKKEVTYSFVNAELDGNHVYLSFEDTENSRIFTSDEEMFMKKFEVEGLYQDYTDIFLGCIGHELYPFLILKTSSGGAEMVDITEGMLHKRWFSMPVAGTGVVKSIGGLDEEIEDGEGSYTLSTIILTNEEGRSVNLLDYLSPVEDSLPGSLSYLYEGCYIESGKIKHHLDDGGSYYSIYHMEFPEDGLVVLKDICEEASMELVYSGYLCCLGMNDEGLVYSFVSYTEESTESTNTLILIRPDYEESDVEIKVLDGIDIFDSKGKWLKFTTVYPAEG